MTEGLRQGVGFLAAGVTATATDAAVLALLTRGFDANPYTARMVAIVVAIIVAFFAHRRLTFSMRTSPTALEFGRFLSVAVSSALVNYAIYAGFLLFRPGSEPLLALFIATVVAMTASFAGMKFGVFRKPLD
ncbi:MAG: GtrA family protein [Hyphomicrobium sp.]